MSQRVRVHHHSVEEREVKPTTREQRKLLIDAGLFLATGLDCGATELIGDRMRPTDFGHWNERDGSVTVVTPGGEIWCGYAAYSVTSAFARMERELGLTKGPIYVHPVPRMPSADILKRQAQMREDQLEMPTSEVSARSSGGLESHGDCGGIIVRQGGQTRCTVCGTLRCGN